MKRKTIIIDGDIASAVDALRDALRAARAPIFLQNNKLIWRFIDGAVFPLTPHRLRFESQQYVTFVQKGRSITPPGALIDMFLSVAATYRWFDDLDEGEE